MTISVDEDGVISFAAPFVRSPYNYDRDAASLAAGLECPEATLTQQQFAEQSDINTIVRNFGLTGELPENLRVPQSGDFTGVVDYHTAMNMVRAAEEAFMELPADVRARFHNDPQELQDFVENADNLEEARKLGIAVPAPVVTAPEPVLVKMAPEEPKTSST